ncbi:hypothetical protein AAHE18_08G251500 [Arachis hypogaea]
MMLLLVFLKSSNLHWVSIWVTSCDISVFGYQFGGRAYSHLTVTHATSFPIVFSIRRQAHRLLHLVHGTVKRIVFSIVFLVAAATQQPTSSPSSASPSASSSAFPFQQQASSSVSRSLSSSQLPPGSSVVFSDHSVRTQEKMHDLKQELEDQEKFELELLVLTISNKVIGVDVVYNNLRSQLLS